MGNYNINKINQLISKYREHENFIGFIHCTELCNFINIYKEGFVFSRNKRKNDVDSANKDQIISTQHKHPEVLKCARFYLAPKTPTYYKMNLKNPVMIVIDENIMSHINSKILFVNKQINSNNAVITSSIDDALKFDYKKIFDRKPKANRNKLKKAIVSTVYTNLGTGQIEPVILINDEEIFLYNPENISVVRNQEVSYFISANGKYVISENSDDIQFRNAEIAFESKVSLDYAVKFYFRNTQDMQEAIKQINADEKDVRFEVNELLFHEYRLNENENIKESDFNLPF